MLRTQKGIIQDRTIYEDVEIFAKNLFEIGHLSKRDWKNYKDLFELMIQFIKSPDLIIYLRASMDTLLNRIKNRDRKCEENIDPEYLYKLNIAYEKWIKSLDSENVLVIDTDNFNIFNDTDKLDSISSNIAKRLKKYDIKVNKRFIKES